MSKQYPGGIVSKNAVVPTSLSASGIWTLDQVADAQATNTWPFPRDPQFNYVTMLLHGDGSALGTTGAGAGASPTQTPFTFDASTNNFNVTINGDTKPNNFNPYQLGYYSNYFSVTAYLSTTGNATTAMGTGDFTWECWVFVPAATTYQTFIDTRSNPAVGTSDGLYFGLNNGTLTPIIFTTSLLASSSVNVTANAWNHVAITRSGTTLTFWVNGASGGTVTNSTNLSNQSVYVGGSTAASVNLTGYLSNARMVKGTAIYSTAFTPSRTPLTAISGTSLLACQANRFIDSSSNAFTFTVTGAPQVAYAQPFTLPSSVATYGSAYFDGSGDYLSVADNAAFDVSAGQEFTVEFWWRPDSLAPAFQEVLTKGDGLQIYTSSSTLNVALSSNNTSTYFVNAGVGVLTANAWNHIALVRSGNIYYGFINGVRTTLVTTSSSMVTGTDPLLIGVVKGVLYPTNGCISNVRFVKGTAVYVSAFTPPTAPLTAISGTSLLTTQFNGGSNNSGFKDASQFNFPITRIGNTTQGSFTPYGNTWSNYFNGTDAYWKQASSANYILGTNDFTLECWINLNSTSTTMRRLFGIGYGANGGSHGTSWEIQYLGTESPTGQISLNRYDGSTITAYTTSGATLNVGQWYHIAVSRTGGNLRIFVNGVAYYNAANSFNFTQVTYGGNTELWTGLGYYGPAGGLGGPRYFGGYISNIRIINGTGIYSSNFTPSTIPLTAVTNTQLLTAQSNRFVDNSTNAQAISAFGSTSVQRLSPFAPSVAYNASSIGGSGYFDGSGDYLTTADNAAFDFGSGNFTVECWIYPTVTGSNGGIVNKRAANANYPPFLLQFDGSTVLFGVSTSGSSWAVFTASAAVSLNAWHHIALVRNGTTITGYVDGAVSITGTATGALTTNSSGIAIGQDQSNSGGNCFKGNIADMRLTKGTALYTAAFKPPTTPLTPITNTSFLLNSTNAGIFDNAMLNDLETVGNAQVSTSVVKYGTGSIYFDGTGDYLTVPSSPNFYLSTGNFTVEAWVYKNSSGTKIIVGQTQNNSAPYNGWLLYVNSSNFAQFEGTNGSSIAATTSFPLNQWVHVAAVRSGSTTTLYVNGTSVASGTVSITDFNGSLNIGQYTFPVSGTEWNGYIDELRITRGVARYVANFTPPDQAFPNG